MTTYDSRAMYLRFALVTTLCLLSSSRTVAMTVNSAVAVGPQLTITGVGFSGTPFSVSFNGAKITINSRTSTQIVATINPLPPAGTYRVVVTAGTVSSTVYVTLSNITAKVSLTNQAAAIPLTTLWTPASDGVYRVSIYMVQVPPFPPSGGCCGIVTLFFQWIDDAGTQTEILGTLQNQLSAVSLPLYEDQCGTYPRTCAEMQFPNSSVSGSPGAVFILQVKGGTPIQYTTDYQSAQTGPAYYDLFMTVEQI